MEKFNAIFDNLEFSTRPTLQNVVPSYYLMIEYCTIDKKQKTSITNLLKAEIAKELDDKYLTSTTQLHWIATYLDPSFKELLFVSDKLYLAEQKKMIKHGIHILANDFKDANVLTNESLHKINSPPKKKLKRILLQQCVAHEIQHLQLHFQQIHLPMILNKIFKFMKILSMKYQKIIIH